MSVLRATSPPALCLLVPLLLGTLSTATLAQGELSDQNRSRGFRMLRTLRGELEDRYYDPTFHGIDLDTLYARARERIAEAPSFTHMLSVIADFMRALGDSHTWFDPPPLRVRAEYGIAWLPVGDRCYITEVREGSDAEAKGVRPGNRLRRINGIVVNRRTASLLAYVFYLLKPSRGLMLDLEQDGSLRTITITAEVTQSPPVIDLSDQATRLRAREEWQRNAPVHTTVTFRDRVLVWRIPEFIYADRHLDGIMNDARDYPALILDMRGNPGGSERAMLSLLGRFFGERIVIGTRRKRDKEEEIRVRPRRGRPYDGKIIILLDAYSASGAEITARTLQREKGAIVVGDVSAGEVMEATYRPHRVGGATRYTTYGALITIADLVLPGGERLEGVGVMPDSLVLPTGEDLAAGRDPQMQLALRLAGVDVTAEQAGALYEER